MLRHPAQFVLYFFCFCFVTPYVRPVCEENKMAFSLCLAEEERLAEVVKVFPCLYDKTTKGYKEKDVVANAWNSVAEQLNFIEDG